jgi:Arc/MetJ family transcription regulator
LELNVRTTLDIPENLLTEAKQLLKTRTKSETVAIALREAVRARQIQYLLSQRGKIDVEDATEELERAELEDARRSR